MAIFLDADSRIIVQGMTGAEGRRHTQRMLAAGSAVLGGVNPAKAGQAVEFAGGISLPVFPTVAAAREATRANVSVLFVPPAHAKTAAIEAIDAGIELLVLITEGIPVHDSATIWAHAATRAHATRIIGPNCPGIISPGLSNAGIIPADITGPGPLGLVSKSGTLTYQLMHELSDIGFSTCLGIGGDPLIGTTHIDALDAFQHDPHTHAIILIGEIGGDAEERAATHITHHITKPVIAYIAGTTAPEGKTMGHAGAIISGTTGTATAKQHALRNAGATIATTPTHTAHLTRTHLTTT